MHCGTCGALEPQPHGPSQRSQLILIGKPVLVSVAAPCTTVDALARRLPSSCPRLVVGRRKHTPALLPCGCPTKRRDIAATVTQGFSRAEDISIVIEQRCHSCAGAPHQFKRRSASKLAMTNVRRARKMACAPRPATAQLRDTRIHDV